MSAGATPRDHRHGGDPTPAAGDPTPVPADPTPVPGNPTPVPGDPAPHSRDADATELQADTADRIEDLRVHQVELEVQLDELRRAETQIAELGERYRQLFDLAPVPLLTVDPTGVITRANAAAQDLLAAGDGLQGRPLVLHVVTDDHAALRPLLRHTGPAPRGATLTFRDRTGTRIPCEVTASALPGGAEDDQGQVLLSLVDRREQERLTAVLAEAERSVAIRQLTGGIAHDCNNLLTVINGNLGLLEDEISSEEGRGWLAAARTASERGGRLVAQLLAYARARSLDPERCELPALLEELHPLLDSAVGEAVTVTIDLDAGLPPVELDPTHLQTAVLNLAINSRDAGSSTVQITARPTERQEVALTVTDDGRGMSPEVSERATTPFFTTKAGATSSGLGLTMVASFAEASGGELHLESRPSGGTTVRLVLPPVREGSPPSHQAPRPTSRSLRRHRILLVEDQDPVRMVTATLLRARVAEVVEVADAEAALAELALRDDPAAPEPAIDVVLSDVVLGNGMDGTALRRQLEATPGAPPVVLVSGSIEGVEGVLRKPYSSAQLVDALLAAVAGASGASGDAADRR